jgi:hypothetical protein
MERISGPHHGFYLASYAAETGVPGGGWLGYAKVCRRRPESYWDANCVVKLCGEGLHESADHAITEAEQRAIEQLRDIVSSAGEAAYA